ncbi:hypothetical protein M408DRAFT_28943 [Serendipita vermifera MAFF 305830]|uniref:F-box domain-containing protein n=1 Tax=Serendipita vermifera MAFF 305830 TaxID=933852 RepID=A0A0C2W6U0_SERVB|nr:hypothetical protein M408DRAFT_28943 [Serendipita vermifera MAFF 305830]
MANSPRAPPILQRTSHTPSCYIVALPNEILAETISWLPHPAHVLSLSYTCKRFHDLLVDPGSAYIWRRVRERFAALKRVATLSDGGPDPFRQISSTGWVDMIELPSSKSLIQLLFEAVPIPGPFDDQSEYALAQMIFGSKKCSECGKRYHGKPREFAMPLPFCPECTQKKPSSSSGKHYIQKGDALKDFKKHVLSSYPAVGVDAFAILWEKLPRIMSHNLPGKPENMLRVPWNRLLAEFVDVVKAGSTSAITEFWKVKITKLREKTRLLIKHSSRLNEWYAVYTYHLQLLGDCVKASSRDFATSHDLKLEDMEKAPSYAHALSLANRQYATDIRPILILNESDVISQTIKIEANRIAGVARTARITRRDQIERFYKESLFIDGVKPTLETFRAIPILQALQDGISTAEVKSKNERPQQSSHLSHKPFSSRASIYDDLRGAVVQDLIRLAVAQWREGAELGARKLLGFGKSERGGRKRKAKDKKGPKEQASVMEVDPSQRPPTRDQAPENESPKVDRDASSMGPAAPMWHSTPGKLGPEMRITSWFVCIRCTNMDPGYKRMRVLDFRGVCAHECSQKDWGKTNAKKWSIDCFNLAPRAIETAKEMLKILRLDAEDSGTTTACLKGWWSCDNCPVWMDAMVWEDLARTPKHISSVRRRSAESQK